jgi:hypothetical protein
MQLCDGGVGAGGCKELQRRTEEVQSLLLVKSAARRVLAAQAVMLSWAGAAARAQRYLRALFS